MIVVDASVITKAYLPEQDSDKADGLLHSKKMLYAPSLVEVEVASAITKACRLNSLNADLALELCEGWFAAVDDGTVQLADDSHDRSEASKLSVQLNHPLQDCLYLSLALRLSLPLLTADEKFARKAQQHSHDVQLLSAL